MEQCYYLTLGLPRSASPADIKEAFRDRAKLLHPDLNPSGDPEAFKTLNEAYTALSDPASRAAYDASRGYFPPPRHPIPRGFAAAPSPHRAVDYEAAAAAAEAEWTRLNFGPEGSARRLREAAARAASSRAPPPPPGAEVGSRKAWSGTAAASRGASETGAYRAWAGQWRAQKAASTKMWRRLGALGALAGGVAYLTLSGLSPLEALQGIPVK